MWRLAVPLGFMASLVIQAVMVNVSKQSCIRFLRHGKKGRDREVENEVSFYHHETWDLDTILLQRLCIVHCSVAFCIHVDALRMNRHFTPIPQRGDDTWWYEGWPCGWGICLSTHGYFVNTRYCPWIDAAFSVNGIKFHEAVHLALRSLFRVKPTRNLSVRESTGYNLHLPRIEHKFASTGRSN